MITTTPTTSWQDLADAHDRAARPAPRGDVPPHRPQVAVLTCADARVSPARLFDLPAGALFVVRVAGASATPEAVASLTDAVDQLGAGAVVVLGHSHCGAVAVAVAALLDDPGPLGGALRDGRAAIHGAVVDLADGSLTRLPD